MKAKSITTILSIATVILFGSQQLGSQLIAQSGPCGGCSTPQNVPYTCVPGGLCSFAVSSPAAKNCVDNCVSTYQCVTKTFKGSISYYANGICGPDGTACYNAVLINTVNNVNISTAVSGDSCLGGA